MNDKNWRAEEILRYFTGTKYLVFVADNPTVMRVCFEVGVLTDCEVVQVGTPFIPLADGMSYLDLLRAADGNASVRFCDIDPSEC